MHLNKNGWSLNNFLVILGVFLIFLIITVYYASVFSYAFLQDDSEYYEELEMKLKDQGRIYLESLNKEDYYDKRIDSYTLGVKLRDEDNNICDGYVLVSKNNNVNAYIKCKNYKTEDYEE